MGYKRNSDEAIDQTIRDKKKYENLLAQFGYDGKRLPYKPFICTEINIPRKQIQQDIGGIEVQRNFAWKAIAQAAKNNIKQVYWFVTAETAEFANTQDGYKLMGLFKNVLATRPGREEMTEEGIANKSAQLLLQDFFYDSLITSSLNLSPAIDGLAWRNKKTGEVRFMLWAKTGRDLDESSEYLYSFPKKYAGKKLQAFKWDYSVTNKPAFVAEPFKLKLGGEPIIFIMSPEKSSVYASDGSRKILIDAGQDTIVKQQFLGLKGSTKSSPGQQLFYYWDIIHLPPTQGDYPAIKNKYTPNAVIMGLQKGVYGIRFTVSDEVGTFATDTVWIGVDTLISIPGKHSQIKTFNQNKLSPLNADMENESCKLRIANFIRLSPMLFLRRRVA
jgi:hypothetical protein